MRKYIDFNFDNPIIKGSLSASEFSIFGHSTNHKLYDDKDGNVIVSYTQSGSDKTRNIGSRRNHVIKITECITTEMNR